MRNGQVSPSVPHSTGKCNKTYFMGLTWEIGTRTFPVVCLLNFSHEIPIIWYTSWDYHIGNAWVSSWISIPSRQVRQLAYFIIHKSSNFWKQSAYCKCFRRTIITNSKLSLILKFSFQSTFKYVSQLSKLQISDTVFLNPLSANPTKWPNTLKQFVGKLPTNCLSVFGHFVDLALKGLKQKA